MLIVVARIKARAGRGDELEEVFSRMVDYVTENEPETLTYICSRSTTDPEQFIFFERYTTQKAFEHHSSSEQFQELAGSIQGKVDGAVEIETYEEVAGKF